MDTLERGACHGGNCHVAHDGTVTFFDFDCYSPGWRIFDLATFRWGTRLHGDDDEPRAAFLEGYRERRAVPDVDVAAVPLFVAIRHIWLLGLHTGNADDWSHGWLTDGYIDRGLTFLREWMGAQIGGLLEGGPAAGQGARP